MTTFFVASILFVGGIIYFALARISSRRKTAEQKLNSSTTKVNLIIGDALPPNAVVFNPDGTIGRTPDTPEVRHKWIVQKMTFKIQQEPDDGEWYFERGRALMALNQYTEAIPDFSKLIELLPIWAGYYQSRGLCYFYTGDKTKALADLKKYKSLEKSERLDDDTIRILDELEKETI